MPKRSANKRSKVDTDQLRKALTLVFEGSPGGTKYSARAAASKYESLNRNRVTSAVSDIRAKTSTDDTEAIRAQIAEQVGGNAGQFASTFTPDEEKVVVEIAMRLDLLGFGMSKKQFMSWCKGIAAKKGYKGAKCDKNWIDGFVQRAKQYDGKFGIGKRSKIDVKRAEKHSAHVFDKFFDSVKALRHECKRKIRHCAKSSTRIS